ncbi:hypothetical protein VP01_3787g3 [Puccinia sorghi]|uniref:Alpha-type protein kinase domain-containing protein n=1 Tax=Puccinia sorghi TaxID=27349 RepID=A0A0L6UTQ4_9BASI|nr:hypothetical protein VP01_3787g3 [Puccinia sorghi]
MATLSEGVDSKTKLFKFSKEHHCTEFCEALHLSKLVEIAWIPVSKKSTNVSPSQSVNPTTAKAIMTSVSSSQPENTTSYQHIGAY